MPSIIFFIITGLIFAITGWGGIIFLVFYTLPYIGYRWLFFFLMMMAISGTALPIFAFFHKRFPGNPEAKLETVIREALLLGFYGDLLVWLQMGRVLTFQVSVFILVGFVIMEILIRVREKSHWSPQEPGNG